MAKGFISSGIPSKNIVAFSHRKKVKYSVRITQSAKLLVEFSDILILSVKPKDASNALAIVKDFVTNKQKLVSVVAGLKTRRLEKTVNCKVFRLMPNINACARQMCAVICKGKNATMSDLKSIKELFSCMGCIIELGEKKFDSATSLSGSGPAFFSRVFEDFIVAGIKIGLTKKESEFLTLHTAIGTAKLMQKNSYSAHDVEALVATPGGTTEAGLKVLDNPVFKQIIFGAISAAREKAKNLR